MAYQKIEILLRKIYDKTMTGNIQWEETNKEGVYQAALALYTILISKRPSRKQVDSIEYVLSINNFTGELIEEVGDEDFDFENSYQYMSQLYDGARRKAMGTDQAIDKILSALDEDIPF
ncbi:MAG: hypothetical protein ACLQED_08900 [Desulfobaccales bacterium]